MTVPSGHRLAAIMFTDIVGYTALMAESEARGHRVRARQREILKPLIESYGGAWIQHTGDEVLASFPSAVTAANCALAIQAALCDEPDLRLRIGLHVGDVVARDGGLHGDGVNITARIRPLAAPGGVCVSDEVVHAIRNQENLKTTPLGSHELKNVGRPVEVYALEGEAAPAAGRAPPGRTARAVALGVGGAALVAVGMAAYVTYVGRPPTEAGPPLTSIAVLPFDDMSPDGDSAWLANGMAEELIETLSRINAFRVVARTSGEIAKRSGKDLDAIGKALKVGSVVEGSVRRSGDQLRITAQLICVADASHLWSARYDRKLEDVFAVQQEIARDIAEAIRVELGVPTSWSWLERQQYVPDDVRAYELVRKGWDLLLTYRQGDVLKAGELFRKAIRLDPDYAMAYTSLAWHHNVLWSMGDVRGEQARLRVEAASRALELEPLQGGANSLLALSNAVEWKLEAAEERLVRALKVHPENTSLRWTYGFVLRDLGQLDESCAQHWKAVELDPLLAQYQLEIAECHLLRGEYDAAIEKFEYVLTINPVTPNARGELALTYHLKGMDAEALEAYVLGFDADPEVQASWRRAFLEKGWQGSNKAIVETLAAQSGRPCSSEPAVGAHLYARAGERDEMYRCLELAIAERGNWLLFLRLNLDWAPYRDEPRFQAILRRVGLVK